MHGREMCTRFWWENLKQRDRLENLSINRIILKRIFKGVEWVGAYWVHLAQDGDKGEGSCENSYEPSGYIKRGSFLE